VRDVSLQVSSPQYPNLIGRVMYADIVPCEYSTFIRIPAWTILGRKSPTLHTLGTSKKVRSRVQVILVESSVLFPRIGTIKIDHRHSRLSGLRCCRRPRLIKARGWGIWIHSEDSRLGCFLRREPRALRYCGRRPRPPLTLINIRCSSDSRSLKR
jgi:hypothetical protein